MTTSSKAAWIPRKSGQQFSKVALSLKFHSFMFCWIFLLTLIFSSGLRMSLMNQRASFKKLQDQKKEDTKQQKSAAATARQQAEEQAGRDATEQQAALLFLTTGMLREYRLGLSSASTLSPTKR
jgi:hypothetical protein